MVVSFVDFFKELCKTNNWFFDYGTQSYHNLKDENSDVKKTFMFLDPIITTPESGELSVKSIKYSGAFLLGVQSDFGKQTYDDNSENNEGKFKTNIEPIYNKYFELVRNKLVCGDNEIVSEKITEVIDRYDLNIDGLFVEFTIRVFR